MMKTLNLHETTNLASDGLAKFARLHNRARPDDLRRALDLIRQGNPELFRWLATLFTETPSMDLDDADRRLQESDNPQPVVDVLRELLSLAGRLDDRLARLELRVSDVERSAPIAKSR